MSANGWSPSRIELGGTSDSAVHHEDLSTTPGDTLPDGQMLSSRLRQRSSESRLGTTGDDGPGLPVAGEGRAFDRFVSPDGQGGAGLRLAIARSLTKAQGGALAYSSRHFVVTLPAITVPGRSHRQAEAHR
jgi:nitrogen-specific signal transduction histidine kinase